MHARKAAIKVAITEMLNASLGNQLDGVDDPFLSYVLSTKLSENLDILRKCEVNEQLNSNHKQYGKSSLVEYQEYYPSLAFECSRKKYRVLREMKEQYDGYQESTKTRRYSVDFDAPSPDTLQLEKMEKPTTAEPSDEMSQLRKRLLGKKAVEDSGGSESEKSVDRQIEDQDNIQSNLLEDMTKLVGSLRQSASAFQNALEEDKTVLSAAEIGVQVASRSLTDISGKLKKYDKKKLGYLFYITVFLFMLIGLLITFIIIKIFPAL